MVILTILNNSDSPLLGSKWNLLSCLQGLGTADNTLIRIMVCRSEIDMLDIRECFRLLYEKSLHNMIKVGSQLLL